PTYMQSTPLIARLFLTKSVANHAMIRAALRRRHSRLAAVLTTLVALALEIIFLRHLFFLLHVKSPTALDGPLFRSNPSLARNLKTNRLEPSDVGSGCEHSTLRCQYAWRSRCLKQWAIFSFNVCTDGMSDIFLVTRAMASTASL